MEFDVNLYQKLDKVRQILKNRGKRIDGRTPTVCTDQALIEIVRLLPQTKEEFLCVPGLGKKFVDNYASHFISVIGNHIVKERMDGQKLTSSHRDTLKELEKKLININRRNRLLYMPKIIDKYAYDLYDPEGRYNPKDILFSI